MSPTTTAGTASQNKAILARLRAAQYDFDLRKLSAVVNEIFAPDCLLQLAHPLGTLPDRDSLVESVYAPLQHAIPDLERRDTIVMAGQTAAGDDWVGCCGYYTGTLAAPWLDIPATGKFVSLRFHEFYRVVDGLIVEMQSLWDIPELMMQANAWPMTPSLGREWHVPGPATQDGIRSEASDAEHTQASFELVLGMCEALGNYASGGVEAMNLERYWHPRCSWYGPAGIGSARGIAGFRNHHQIPFLNGMPDRVGSATAGHMFAEGDYVGFTAWPGMRMTISGDGWLGIAPAKQKITMRSLDFWRCENGMIRENWVLVDLLDVYQQIGVDVLHRMRELRPIRNTEKTEMTL
jgi:predicted ester cyclase